MYGQLQQAVRPELSEEEAVADLVMLCKQGIGIEALEEVLSTLLTVQPTDRMRTALRTLYDSIPRWVTLKTGRIQ